MFATLPAFGLVFTVSNIADSAGGSLRQAILDANGSPGADTINFNIAGAGPHVIALTSALPTITEQLTIDGYMQPGASPNTLINASDAVIKIVLQGQAEAFGGIAYSSAADDSVVRGLSLGGFSTAIFIDGATNISILGNYVGISPSGAATPNNLGVVIANGATGCKVGSSDVADRNVISGNGTGVTLSSNNHFVTNNLIGTTPDGMDPGPNGSGISILDANGNLIGPDNVISGNTAGANARGIMISGSSSANTITANSIGADVNLDPLPNRRGVWILDNAGLAPSNNDITLNQIQFNLAEGVVITRFTNDSLGNRIRNNNFTSNGGLGIDLDDDGVTMNDAGDGDAGSNHRQNFPVLTSAVASGGQLTIGGTLDALPGSGNYTVELFHDVACDPLGFGEGRPIGTTTVTAGAGPQPFTVTIFSSITTGIITATATSQIFNDTSEFSLCQDVAILQPPPALSISDATILEGNSGMSNVALTVTLSRTDASDVQVTYATSDGTATAPSDYTSTSATLTIPAGSTTGTILFPISGDTAVETDETFTVTLSAPQNATIADGSATVTITNDDTAAVPPTPIPTLSALGLALVGAALALLAFLRMR